MIHAMFKHLHHKGEYCKGRGREYKVYSSTHHSTKLLPPFARALGARMDLKFDGCIALLLHRVVAAEFLRGYLDCPKSEGILDRSLYTVLRCNEFTGLLSANSLWKFIFSEPFRWLSGKTTKLAGFSLFKMCEALDLVDEEMERIAADPARALDPSIDIFAPIAAQQPEFKDWQKELLSLTVTAADGKTKFLVVQEVLKLVRTPPPGSGEELARPFVLKVIKAQAERALEKLHDKRLALANKLTSQEGDYSIGKNADAHKRTIGVHGCNDAVENKFATGDFVMRTFRGISVCNASGIVEQRNGHDFERPLQIKSDRRKRKAGAEAPMELPLGFFWRLASSMRHSLLRVGARLAPEMRRSAAADKAAHDDEKLARREEAVERQLSAAVERYAEALELFDAWRASSVVDGKPLDAAALLAALDKQLRSKSATEKLAILRKEIEMRTKGVGWTQFAVSFSFESDEKEGKIKAWRTLLRDEIYPHEMVMRRTKKLPKAAAPPQLKTRLAKTLGTADPDVLALEEASSFNVINLLKRAEVARLCGGRRKASPIASRRSSHRGPPSRSSWGGT